VATRVRLDEGGTVFLEEGAVYVDSAGASPEAAVAVHQAFGVVYEVGTRFEVRIVDDGLRVRVREGRVDVEVDGARHAAPAGEEVTVGGDGGLVRRAVLSWGEGWEWIVQSAPPFTLEGRTVAEVLDWVARETGWRISYADATLAADAAEIVVYGSVMGLRPDETPGLVLPSSGLDFALRDGELVVRRRSL
jgi:ferric-dicitrate binding protein FerR (iron transport regulator)